MKGLPIPLIVAGLVLGCGSSEESEEAPPLEKLNVIIINVDDLGWTDLGCYGSAYYETPNIDRLARQGLRFTNAYAAAAVCSPSRAAIMTGRYPARTGITDWIHHLDAGEETLRSGRNPTDYVGGPDRKLLCPPNPYWMELDEITLAEALQAAGYLTGHIGKWHLGHESWFPDKQGFDVNIGGTEIGQPPSYFDPFHLNERRPNIATLPPRREGEYLTDRESDEAVGFLKANADRSFFLNWCPYAVHTPLEAKEDMVAKYEAKPKTNHDNPVYAAMIESVDQAVGRLMATLDEENLADRTVIFFTSDNGGLLEYSKGHSTDNSPLRSGKGYPYEGGIRAPLMVRWPGVVEAGTTSDVPVSGIDLFPTISRIAGVDLPEDRSIDGESFLGVLKQTDALQRDTLIWHFPHYREPDILPYSIIRKGDWKLIKRYEGEPFELYNLGDDLGEEQDLAGPMPDKVRELNAELEARLEEIGGKLPRTNPDYRP